MKRLIPCAILGVCIILVCVLGNIFIKKSTAETFKELKSCEEAYNSDDFEAAARIALNTQNNWEERKERLYMFVNHSMLDEISENLSRIPFYADAENHTLALSEISAAKEMLEHISETQKIGPKTFY